MTELRARWNRISIYNKRAIFITGCMIAMFHAVAVVIALVEDSSMLIGVALLDAIGVVLFAATLAAERLFPYRSKR